MQGIYCIINKNTGKKYYGSSSKIEERINGHISELNSNKHHNILLQRSWNKHGSGSFDFQIIEITNFENLKDLLRLEQKYIDENKNGFNLAPANGGDIISNHPNKKEILKRRSNTLNSKIKNMSKDERKLKYGKSGPKNGMFGKTHTDEVRKKLKQINSTPKEYLRKPKKWTEEGLNKLRELARERTGENNGFYGKTHSDETKEKIRQYQKENNWMKNRNPEELSYTRKYQINYPDGTKIIKFGLKEVSDLLGVSITAISNQIKNFNGKWSKGKLKNIEVKRMAQIKFEYEAIMEGNTKIYNSAGPWHVDTINRNINYDVTGSEWNFDANINDKGLIEISNLVVKIASNVPNAPRKTYITIDDDEFHGQNTIWTFKIGTRQEFNYDNISGFIEIF